MSSSGRLVALCGLAALALSFAPSFRPREISERLGVHMDTSRDPGFAFDPRYREFLAGVERLTPGNASVAVFAPATSELYLAQAAYRLTPRRVVSGALASEAQFSAVYRRGPAPPVPEGATPLPGGFLLKR